MLGANATELQIMSLNALGQAASIQNLNVFGSANQAGLALSVFDLQAMNTFIKA
jgi:hypothetical protein